MSDSLTILFRAFESMVKAVRLQFGGNRRYIHCPHIGCSSFNYPIALCRIPDSHENQLLVLEAAYEIRVKSGKLFPFVSRGKVVRT